MIGKREIFSCFICPNQRGFSQRWHDEHMKKYHGVSKTTDYKRKAICKEFKKVMKKKRKTAKERNRTLCITGDTGSRFGRPWLKLVLMKRGFLVRDSPSEGTKALICGNSHNPTKMDVKSYKKYTRAVENNVRIISMDELPQFLDTTPGELEREIGLVDLKCERLKFGDTEEVEYFVWEGLLRFAIISESVNTALMNK